MIITFGSGEIKTILEDHVEKKIANIRCDLLVDREETEILIDDEGDVTVAIYAEEKSE